MLNVEIDGTNAGSGANGLVVTAGASTIEGLVIANFGSQASGSGGNGIVLQTAGGNLVTGNFIGTNSTGTAGTNIAGDDVLIELGSSGNTVGGLTPDGAICSSITMPAAARVGAGVDIEGTSGNLVVGNFLGTDATGTKSLAGGTNSTGSLDRRGRDQQHGRRNDRRGVQPDLGKQGLRRADRGQHGYERDLGQRRRR